MENCKDSESSNEEGQATKGMKAAVAGMEEFPRKMEGWTKEGRKEAVARVERLLRTIKGWTEEDRKDFPCLPSTSFIFSFNITSKTLHISFCNELLSRDPASPHESLPQGNFSDHFF